MINVKTIQILVLTALLLVRGSQSVSAQQGVAQDAYAIFEQSCNICHGPDGAYKETLLIEHTALIQNGTVVPGNPDASELYTRLITTETAKRMPLGQPQLPAQTIDTIRNWILSGAPDWTPPPVTDRDFISPNQVLNTIETHLTSLAPFDRAFARYFTMTHLYNAGESGAVIQAYQKGLNKLINSLSWGSTVINPTPIDEQKTILYIDLRHYEWDVNDAWGQIETEYPYHIGFDAPTQTALKAQLGRLQGEMQCDIPSVYVDWFLANASLPPLYHDLLSLPLTDRGLETRLEVDVTRNLLNAPGVRVWRAGTNNSGVSNHNRVIERHTSQHGAYWKSYDFAGSVGSQNIFTHPLSFTHDGGEVIFNLPNGLQGYYITTGSGTRLDAAPIQIVSNPAASDPTVRNGLSCFGCHTEGMKTFSDEVRAVIESNTTPAFDKAQALRLYVEQSEMDGLIAADMDRYETALEATGGAVDDIEPISRFHEVYQSPIDAAYAASVVGLETEAFLAKVRENAGLQRLGLLALDGVGGSMKRDAWTEGFDDVIFALDFPERVTPPPDVTPSQPLPGGVVHIPDTNLRAAIAEALSKSPTAPITVEDMEGLERLEARYSNIHDLTGIQFATNLSRLDLRDNQISDISPLAGLIQLRDLRLENTLVSDLSPVRDLENLIHLWLDETSVSDLSPIRNLKNLTDLQLRNATVSDLSPIAGLVNLRFLDLASNNISDLSPLAGLINLKWLALALNNISDLSPLAGLINIEALFISDNDNISDLSPLAGLINLKKILSWGNAISDLSPLAGLTKLEYVNICGADFSDLTPLAGLTSLKELYLRSNRISDISPIAELTGLTRLNLSRNDISDISSLVGLTNLEWLRLNNNEISDFSPLDGLRENIKLIWYDNPGYPKGGPKIEGPWLWAVLSEIESDQLYYSSTDLLSEASGGIVTETEIATHGAIEGKSVGTNAWVSHKLPPTGRIQDMLKDSNRGTVIYGSISLHSPQKQDTTMYVGSTQYSKVWLNGNLIHHNTTERESSRDYTDFYPVTLKQGRNVLLVALSTLSNGFFGFASGTDYTVANPGVGYTFSKTPIHVGDTFTLDISAANVFDLAAWQFDIVFAPAALEAVNVSEGNFLKTGANTFFQGGSIDNVTGKITGLNAVRLSTQGVTGTGSLLHVNFTAKSGGDTKVALQNFEFGAISGESIPAGPHQITVTVEGQLATGDVNRDGQVTSLDLVLVAQKLNQTVSADDPADVNGDGVVNTVDLIIVSQAIGSTAAPAAPSTFPPLVLASRSIGAGLGLTERRGPRGVTTITPAMIEAWIAQARLEDDGSLAFKEGIENLEKLLASLIPEETALLANYPNPFNPETWIPYQLAESAEVMLTIYDMNGEAVRRLAVGHQAAGMYQSRNRAAYWDGRNQLGEVVASGVYFYTLTTGDFTATRRMVIMK